MAGGDLFASRRIQLVAALGGGDAQVIWTSPKGAKLWLGSAAASLTETVTEREIGAVVRVLAEQEVDDVLREQPLNDVPGIRMMWIRAPDRASTDLLSFFEHTCAFLDRHFGDEGSSSEALSSDGPSTGSSALIHCVMGVSRSAAVAAAFLMHLQRPEPDETIRVLSRLRACRGAVRPNAGFTRQLDQWQLHLKEGTVPSDDFNKLQDMMDHQQAQLLKGTLRALREDSWVRSTWVSWCAEHWTQPKGFLRSRSLIDMVKEAIRDDDMMLTRCVFRAMEWVLGDCGREPARVRWMEDLLSISVSASVLFTTPNDHQSPKGGTVGDSTISNEAISTDESSAAGATDQLPPGAENPLLEVLLLKTLLSHEWLETWASDVPALMAADGLAARWLVAAKGLRVAQKQQNCLHGLAAEAARLAAAFHLHSSSDDDDGPARERFGALAIGDNNEDNGFTSATSRE